MAGFTAELGSDVLIRISRLGETQTFFCFYAHEIYGHADEILFPEGAVGVVVTPLYQKGEESYA